MKDGTLDELTARTFKWIRNRPTASEREHETPNPDDLPEIIAREKRADKGRISRLISKVRRVAEMPRYAQEMCVSE